MMGSEGKRGRTGLSFMVRSGKGSFTVPEVHFSLTGVPTPLLLFDKDVLPVVTEVREPVEVYKDLFLFELRPRRPSVFFPPSLIPDPKSMATRPT